MTRKDFNAIAAAFKQARADIEAPDSLFSTEAERLDAQMGLTLAEQRVVDVLAASNPLFDRARFFKAAMG